MHVAIRADSSLKMGTGHVYRMLTLATHLKMHGHKVVFVSRLLEGNMIRFVEKCGFLVLTLPCPDTSTRISNLHCTHGNWLEVSYTLEIEQSKQLISKYLAQEGKYKLDWLVIDHYSIEQDYQNVMSALCNKMLQVDDLADRNHIVDVLMDQNFYIDGPLRYNRLIPKSCQRLCGPDYSLLRNDFILGRNNLPSFEDRFYQKKVVLFFGGIDLTNETEKALKGLLKVVGDEHFDVIIGGNNPNRKSLEVLCKQNQDRTTLHIQISNMTEIFANSYLYVGAVGATTWERCVMGLPGIVCSVAENQIQLAKDLSHINGHYYLGINTELSEQNYIEAFESYRSDIHALKTQSLLCKGLVDGLGGERVVSVMEEVY